MNEKSIVEGAIRGSEKVGRDILIPSSAVEKLRDRPWPRKAKNSQAETQVTHTVPTDLMTKLREVWSRSNFEIGLLRV